MVNAIQKATYLVLITNANLFFTILPKNNQSQLLVEVDQI
jgi:hypothetical protein